MQERVMMKNIPDIFRKRDIKREFKAAGYGSIDEIVFQYETCDGFNNFNNVYVLFRPTTKTRVLEKRKELYTKDTKYIDICCEKTPRTHDGCFQRWFIRPIEEKTQRDSTDMNMDIKKLALIVERHKNIIYQLLGGLFTYDSQNYVLEDYISYLFNGEHIPVPKDECNFPITRQGIQLEKRVKELDYTYERKLAAVEKRFENIEHRIPSYENDTYERKLAALEKRFDDCEFQLPSHPPPNDTYERKLAALEKKFDGLYREMSYTASFAKNIDGRLRAACDCLTREI